jgi:maleate cis-trans isomerase
VTLVITTLTVTERSEKEVDVAYEMSMRAARELAAAGVDLVFLGGVPVNLSRGNRNAQDMLGTLAAELGVKVSSSVAAQGKAAKVLGCKKVVVAHPYGAREDARLIADAERYGCEVLGAMGRGKVIRDFGRTPMTAALDMGRALMRAHPQADAIFLPSPHWPVIEAIEALEQEFGVTVMAASQACAWDALRLIGVDDAMARIRPAASGMLGARFRTQGQYSTVGRRASDGGARRIIIPILNPYLARLHFWAASL